MGDRQEKKNSRNGKDSPGMNAGQKRLLQWHPAFFAGLQIELSEEAEYLSFESEHMLSSRPMQLDILVIKKDRERQIRKNIGQIFRTYNIVEYKSPDDSLTIDDFYKVYGYTCFYKADTGKTNEIRAEELTISLVCSRYPRELMRYLTQEEHRFIEQKEDGIYYIHGGMFPVQIIVTKQLSEESNLWLKSLTNDLGSDRAVGRLLHAYEKHRTEGLYQSVMDVVVRANEERFMVSDMSDMCQALDEILDKRAAILAEERLPKLVEERLPKLAEEKAAILAEQKLLELIRKKIRKGKSMAQIADELEEKEESILPLYNRLKEEEGL